MDSNKISYFSWLYLIAWCISPPLAYGTLYRGLAILSILIIIIYSLKTYVPNLRNRFLQCVLLCFYIFVICFFTGDPYVGKIGVFVILLTSTSFALWNHSYGNNIRQLHFLILFALSLYCIWNTTTLLALVEEERLMRMLVQNSDISEICAQNGIGGYGYLYSVIAMLPIGISMMGIKQNIIFRIIVFYFVISGFILSYMSQYFMGLLLAILIIPMMYVAHKNQGTVSVRSYIIIFGLVFLIFYNLELILEYLIDVVDLSSVNHKLVEMQDALINGEDVEDTEFGDRYLRYARDLNLILQSPIFGVFNYTKVGKHSSILDFFAQYGIPLGIVYVKIIFSSCLDWIRMKIPVASVVLWVIFIISIMNVLPLSAAVPLCIALPAYCKMSWLKSQSSIILAS